MPHLSKGNVLLNVDRLTEEVQRQFRIYFCRSAYVAGMNASRIENMDSGKGLYLVENPLRKLQNISETYKFSRTVRSRSDSVMDVPSLSHTLSIMEHKVNILESGL